MMDTVRAATVQRLLLFVPARRNWSGAGRNAFTTATELAYLALPAEGAAIAGRAALGQMPRARSVDLVFDFLDVHTAAVEAPRLNEAKLRLALPNLLEERLLVDPGDCHFAYRLAEPGTGGAAGRLGVAAITRTTLTRVLEAAAQAQLPVRAAYSEMHLIPPPSGATASARVAAGRVLVRTGTDQACIFDLETGAAAALHLAKAQYAIGRLRTYGGGSEKLAAMTAPLGISCEDAHADADSGAIDTAVNLLQGQYSSAGNSGVLAHLLSRAAHKGAWKAPAAWVGAWALIGIAGLNAYWIKLEGQNQDLRQSMRHAFRDAFPAEPTIIDEVAQAQRLVANLRARAGQASPDDFSVLNTQALQLLSSAPVGIVTAIEYADRSYRIHFRPGSVDNAELRNALQGRALAQGLALRFEPDGSVLLAPGGG